MTQSTPCFQPSMAATIANLYGFAHGGPFSQPDPAQPFQPLLHAHWYRDEDSRLHCYWHESTEDIDPGMMLRAADEGAVMVSRALCMKVLPC